MQNPPPPHLQHIYLKLLVKLTVNYFVVNKKEKLYLELISEHVSVSRLTCNSRVSNSYRTRFISITKQDRQFTYKRNIERVFV